MGFLLFQPEEEGGRVGGGSPVDVGGKSKRSWARQAAEGLEEVEKSEAQEGGGGGDRKEKGCRAAAAAMGCEEGVVSGSGRLFKLEPISGPSAAAAG